MAFTLERIALQIFQTLHVEVSESKVWFNSSGKWQLFQAGIAENMDAL